MIMFSPSQIVFSPLSRLSLLLFLAFLIILILSSDCATTHPTPQVSHLLATAILVFLSVVAILICLFGVFFVFFFVFYFLHYLSSSFLFYFVLFFVSLLDTLWFVFVVFWWFYNILLNKIFRNLQFYSVLCVYLLLFILFTSTSQYLIHFLTSSYIMSSWKKSFFNLFLCICNQALYDIYQSNTLKLLIGK